MPPHPRRLKLDQVLARLRDPALVSLVPGSRVVEMPIRSLITEAAPPPAIAVMLRPESVAPTTQDGGTLRELSLVISIAGRTALECDDVANEVEDALAGVVGLVLARTEFAYNDESAEDRVAELPFFAWMLTYALSYATTAAAP